MNKRPKTTAVRKIPHCQIFVFKDGEQISTFTGTVYYLPFAKTGWKLQVRYQKMYRAVRSLDIGQYRLDLT